MSAVPKKVAGKKNNRAVCSFQSADDPVGDHLPVAVLEMIAGLQQRASWPARDLTTVEAADYVSGKADRILNSNNWISVPAAIITPKGSSCLR